MSAVIESPLEQTIAAAHQQFTVVEDAKRTVEMARSKKAELETELERKAARRARLVELDDADAAARVLDGDDAVPLNEKRSKEREALDRDIPAIKAALPLQSGRAAAAEAELEAARSQLVPSVLQVALAIQDPAAKAIHDVLPSLTEPLARLMAADLVRERVIGRQHAVPEGQQIPFAGGVVARRFITAIPVRLRPPELTEEALAAAAEKVADEILFEIQGAIQ